MSEQPSSPLKVGLIGCGHVGFYYHLPAIFDTPDLQIHAIYDPDPGQLAKGKPVAPMARLFTEPEPFFQSGLDAVVVTSPAPCHLENVLHAARYRLPVLCEKPLSMNLHEGEQMRLAMEAAGQPLYTAFCYRFSPVALKIRELLSQNAIGEPRTLRLIYNWNLKGKYVNDPSGIPGLNLRRKARMLEGGPMIDCGTHQVDLARFWLASEITRFTGHGSWVEDYEAPDHMWLHLDHSCGAHTTVEMSFSYHHVSRTPRREFVYEIIGTDGVVRYDRDARSFHLDHAKGREILPFHHEKNFAGMYKEFASALRCGHSSLLASAADGLRVSEIISEATSGVIAKRPLVATL